MNGIGLSAIFSTKVLAQIVCFLGGILVMKSLSAHDPLFSRYAYQLKSPTFWLSSEAENPHILRVLSIGDEFR